LNNFKILIIFKFFFSKSRQANRTQKTRETCTENRIEKTLGALMGRGRYSSARGPAGTRHYRAAMCRHRPPSATAPLHHHPGTGGRALKGDDTTAAPPRDTTRRQQPTCAAPEELTVSAKCAPGVRANASVDAWEPSCS
jgi:hypothetical protein